MRRRPAWAGGLLVASAVALAGCGGAGSAAAPSGTPSTVTTSASPTITITASGIDTKRLVVSPGTQVTFVNHDSIPHLMFSDPHPEHTDCPEINQVGYLQPGDSRQTGNLNTVRSCGFHDHNLPAVTSLQGTIVIQ